ncbi:uncharacterized protein LOC108734101, partial [Caligus rogercresseyi]
KDPDLWFAKVEAQFATANVTASSTKFNHILKSLDQDTVREIREYEDIKAELLEIFGPSQASKDGELFGLSGLGDRKPTSEMLIRAFFLVQLPADIRKILAVQEFHSVEAMAKAADNIYENRSSQQISVVSYQPQDNPSTEGDTEPVMAVVKSCPAASNSRMTNPTVRHNVKDKNKSVSFTIGTARKRVPAKPHPFLVRSLGGIGKRTGQEVMGAAPVLAIGKHAFTLGDRISGRSFLVDTGAEVSAYSKILKSRSKDLLRRNPTTTFLYASLSSFSKVRSECLPEPASDHKVIQPELCTSLKINFEYPSGF